MATPPIHQFRNVYFLELGCDLDWSNSQAGAKASLVVPRSRHQNVLRTRVLIYSS